jgi:2-dehydropantoate 2-reductase
MRVCIYGAGAIGGHLAARLAASGAAVSVVARGAHLEAIRSRGLRLIAQGKEIEARVLATDDPRELGPQDAVFVTVKAYALPSIAAKLPALLGSHTTVVFALNGIPWWYHAELGPGSRLDPDESLKRNVGLQRTVACILYPFDEIVSPGVVRNVRPGPYVLGEPGGEASERCLRLSALLAAAKLEAPVTARIRSEIWNKLLLNVANGAVCILAGCTLRELASDPDLRALSLRLMHETRAVAAAHGIPGLGEPETMLPPELPAFQPSMQKDLEAGRPTEFEAIYLATVDFARAAGIATPLLDAIVPLLRQRIGVYTQKS